jgi:hypothetical protein
MTNEEYKLMVSVRQKLLDGILKKFGEEYYKSIRDYVIVGVEIEDEQLAVTTIRLGFSDLSNIPVYTVVMLISQSLGISMDEALKGMYIPSNNWEWQKTNETTD